MVKELFVYGTLMQNTNSRMARFLHDRARLLGTAYVTGKLYDLGSYPGAVYDPEASERIAGQIYQLAHPEEVFSILDHYEGVSDVSGVPGEYVRRLVPATLNGTVTSCWMYQYNFDPGDLPQIPSGNYLTYFTAHRNHRNFIERGR